MKILTTMHGTKTATINQKGIFYVVLDTYNKILVETRFYEKAMKIAKEYLNN